MFLAPWIILTVPSQVFFGFGSLLAPVVIAVGLSGTLARKERLTILASVALLGLLIAGKIGIDLARAEAPDTSILLVQFVSIIFFFEASKVVSSFDKEARALAGKTDEVSNDIKERLYSWVRGQLSQQAQFLAGALGLSLALLVLGGLASVSVSQSIISGVLVVLVIGVLLFLITQRREPETSLNLPDRP